MGGRKASYVLALLACVNQAATWSFASIKISSPFEERVMDLRKSISVIQDLDISYDHDVCHPRDPESPPGRGYEQGLTRELGVVIVLCNEDLSSLSQIGCRGDRMRYYLYSRCGVGGKHLKKMLEPIEDCMVVTTVSPHIYTELTRTTGHSDFLSHIISNYEMLDENLLFIRASLAAGTASGMMSMAEAIDLALSGKWAYKALWPTKASLAFDRTPIPGVVDRYFADMCLLYKRFTCEAECYSCPHDNDHNAIWRGNDRPVDVSRCAYINPGSSFITTASRIRTLAVTEYSWLRVWLESWQEDSQGSLRRQVAERVWPLLLGCPEDLHSNISDAGCAHDMHYSLEGKELKPPEDLVNRGIVPFPPPTLRHDSKHPYAKLTSPIYRESRDITFVVTYGGRMPPNELAQPLIQGLVGDVIYFHPSARVVILVHSDVAPFLRQNVYWKWFAGRVDVLEIETINEIGHFGELHQDLDIASEVKDWTHGNWMSAFRFEMRQQFLRMVADDQIYYADGEQQTSHIVFLSLNTALVHNVWDAFEGQPFALGLPIRPLDRRPIDSAVMYVHKDMIHQAADQMDEILNNRLLRNGFLGSFDEVLNDQILSCLPAKWYMDNTTRVVKCPQSETGADAPIKLMPAPLWNGMVVKGDSKKPLLDLTRFEWAASVAHEDARVIQVILLSGSLSHEMVFIFKTVRERHDREARHFSLHKRANLTYSYNSSERHVALREAASLEQLRKKQLSVKRKREFMAQMGYHLVQTSRGRKLKSSGGEKNFSPEEELYDWDDPFFGYMYEILHPQKPSAEDYVLPKESDEGPFPRHWHNRQYLDRVEKTYKKHYGEHSMQPSPSESVKEYWKAELAKEARVARPLSGSRTRTEGKAPGPGNKVADQQGAGERIVASPSMFGWLTKSLAAMGVNL